AAAAIRHRTVEANGIAMHVAESGPEDGPAVLFLHGFPELWYSWRHQMAHLAARGYRCVAPDLRGYGGTEAPADVASYTAFHVVGDAVALLDALGIGKVFVVGHDWGAIIAWYLCLFRPDRVTALVNTSVAFMRHVFIRAGAAAVKTTDYFNQAYGPTYYICRFQSSVLTNDEVVQEPGVAEKEFAPAHARHLMTRILSDRFSERAAGKEPKDGGDDADVALPPWLTEADIDYFAAAFEKTGFTGAINYYRNMDRNWELAAPGIQDYLHKGGLKADVPLLEELVVVPGAGHFIQQERAQEVSDHIHDFITVWPNRWIEIHRLSILPSVGVLLPSGCLARPL
uniref:AB hydrolase-1 domain-containing protein n=1 Tax=Aegilops tauschii subsp. strangulata TaxID=200361 RepID=A0A453MBS9_AEGTS